MYCLRCGRETRDDHVFCDSCAESMKKYPVRPGTAVLLPRHKETAAVRKARRHTPAAPKEQIRKLRKQRRVLVILVLILLLALAASITAGLFYVRREDQSVKPGQNYVVVETTAPQ